MSYCALITSYERDSETNLDTAINQMYSPQMGRFMSADPYRPSGYKVDPQSWNRFSYTRNNPINRVDPLGLDDCPIGANGIPNCGSFGGTTTIGYSNRNGGGGNGGDSDLMEDSPKEGTGEWGGDGGGDPTQQAQLGQIKPNFGPVDGYFPGIWYDPFMKAFEAIQTEKCKRYVENTLSSPEFLGRPVKFEDLLQKAVFHFYDRRNFTNPNSPSVQYIGGWQQYQKYKPKLEKGFAATVTGTNKVYILSDFADLRTNQGRAIVHELFHVAGIATPEDEVDPINKLDSAIREHCSYGGPN